MLGRERGVIGGEWEAWCRRGGKGETRGGKGGSETVRERQEGGRIEGGTGGREDKVSGKVRLTDGALASEQQVVLGEHLHRVHLLSIFLGHHHYLIAHEGGMGRQERERGWGSGDGGGREEGEKRGGEEAGMSKERGEGRGRGERGGGGHDRE